MGKQRMKQTGGSSYMLIFFVCFSSPCCYMHTNTDCALLVHSKQVITPSWEVPY